MGQRVTVYAVAYMITVVALVRQSGSALGRLGQRTLQRALWDTRLGSGPGDERVIGAQVATSVPVVALLALGGLAMAPQLSAGLGTAAAAGPVQVFGATDRGPGLAFLASLFAPRGFYAEVPTARGGVRPVVQSVLSSPGDVPDPGPQPGNFADPVLPRAPVIHTVRSGDTVNRIAARFGLQPNSIIWANGLVRPDHIIPGQRLAIPSEDLAEPPASVRWLAATGSGASRTREETFIASLVEGARESQRVTGVPASITIAQAILETYWGSSYLAREANNYFGIKAHRKPGPAGVIWIDAWEVENGQNVTRPEPFRKYNSIAESLVDHGHFFLENGRYARALAAIDDPREFARRINAAGYATDPGYAAKLISHMDRYDLYQYDR